MHLSHGFQIMSATVLMCAITDPLSIFFLKSAANKITIKK